MDFQYWFLVNWISNIGFCVPGNQQTNANMVNQVNQLLFLFINVPIYLVCLFIHEYIYLFTYSFKCVFVDQLIHKQN